MSVGQIVCTAITLTMMFIAILAATICVAASVPPPSCVVGPWGEWSECRGSVSCTPAPVAQSRPMSDEKKALGKGREAMKKIMAMKNANYAKKQACIEDGSCPENLPPKSVRALTPCVDGMAGLWPCSNVDMLSFTNFADLGYPGTGGNDIWVWHDLQEGDDYAIMGLIDGTSFVRVTDPENPVVVGILDTETFSSSWRDMKVIGDFAYIVSEASGHGMQVFDLSQLRGLGSDPSNKFTATAVYHGVSNTHNIVANPASNTVFLVGATGAGDPGLCHVGGLHMVDVSDPTEPRFAGCFDDDGYVHDAQCLFYEGPDDRHVGKEICYCFNEDSFTIVDITNKQAGVMLSRVEYDGVAYSHQGWATEDNVYLYLDDELDEFNGGGFTRTYIWDISNLENPVNQDVHLSTERSSDHNLYIRGNYMHQSNYKAGYRLQELNSDGSFSEVGFFDVYPSETTPGFEGTWSNYPWLDDEVHGQFVVVSSINNGLFILKPDFPAINAAKASGTPQGHTIRHREAIYGKEGATCPAFAENKPCTPQAC